MLARCLFLASGKQVLHVEEACLRLKGTSVFSSHAPLSPSSLPSGHMETLESSSIHSEHMYSGLSQWGQTHTQCMCVCVTLPPGSLAQDQKCKAMFWLGSVTCSQGSPSHGRMGDRNSSFFPPNPTFIFFFVLFPSCVLVCNYSHSL